MASRRSNLPVCPRSPVDCYFAGGLLRYYPAKGLSLVSVLYHARTNKKKKTTAEGEEGAFAFKVAHFCIKKDCRKPEQEVSWL